MPIWLWVLLGLGVAGAIRIHGMFFDRLFTGWHHGVTYYVWHDDKEEPPVWRWRFRYNQIKHEGKTRFEEIARQDAEDLIETLVGWTKL